MRLSSQSLAVLGDRREELGLGRTPLALALALAGLGVVAPDQGCFADARAVAYSECDADVDVGAHAEADVCTSPYYSEACIDTPTIHTRTTVYPIYPTSKPK